MVVATLSSMFKSLYRIGIDIGGTGTKFGVVTPEGSIAKQAQLPTKNYATPELFADAISTELKSMMDSFGGTENFQGIGIGAPNGNFYNGNIEHAPNLLWKGIVPMASLLKDRMGLPTILTNDANAAAMGEMMFGAARGMKDFFVVTLGTGLGSGFVADGKVVYGKNGSAGELGHVIVKKNGRACGCGRAGCLQMYLSAIGLEASSLELMGTSMAPLELTAAANKGSTAALQIFEEAGEILGEALSNAALLFGPEAIILSGGVSQAGELILEPTRKSFEASLMQVFKGTIKIMRSDLRENESAILGAAALI
jgi:glucokinase